MVAVTGVQRKRIAELEDLITVEHYVIPSDCAEENLVIGWEDYEEGRFEYYDCYVVADSD